MVLQLALRFCRRRHRYPYELIILAIGISITNITTAKLAFTQNVSKQ